MGIGIPGKGPGEPGEIKVPGRCGLHGSAAVMDNYLSGENTAVGIGGWFYKIRRIPGAITFLSQRKCRIIHRHRLYHGSHAVIFEQVPIERRHGPAHG